MRSHGRDRALGAGSAQPLAQRNFEAAPHGLIGQQPRKDGRLGAGSFGKNQDAATAVRTAEGLSTPTAVAPTPQIVDARGVPFNAPAASVPRAASWDEANKLRNSLNEAWIKAVDRGDKQAAAALAQQRHTLDAAIEQHLAPDQLAAWQEANASHAAKMDRFHTGPQAAIFQTRNGAPLVQGGEVVQRFWGAHPGAEADVQAFQRLVDENPAMLGQFKSMITTEGAGTVDRTNALTSKFSKWFEQHTPGLRQAFSPEELDSLSRIAQDIDRHSASASAGTSLGGSNTYQNASNALDLGVLDSQALTSAAKLVPKVGPWALDGVRGVARNSKATKLAALLSDNEGAARALEMIREAHKPRISNEALSQLFAPSVYRGAPRSARQN